MRRKTAVIAASGVVALTAIGGAVVGIPALAEDRAESSNSASHEEAAQTRIADSLKPLVDDGTLTQEQADKVASTLASERGFGHGGRHGGHGTLGGGEALTAASSAIGITEDELRTKLQSGSTLGQVADEAGVDRQKVVDAIVKAEQDELAQRVKDGTITQAQADEFAANLESRATQMLDRSGMRKGGHHGGSQPTASPSPTTS